MGDFAFTIQTLPLDGIQDVFCSANGEINQIIVGDRE